MREVVNVHVGHCGNSLGSSYWRRICEEHGVSADGVFAGDCQQQAGLGTHFHDCDGRRFVPRSVHVDLDSASLDQLRASDLGPLFRPDNFIGSRASSGNNWCIGHNTEGAEIICRVLEVIRKETESCDRLHGFNYTFSLEGSAGSGLGMLVQARVREEYPKCLAQSFNVFPSPNISHCVVEPYNAGLSVQHLVANLDLVHVFDNEALLAFHAQALPDAGKAFRDLNQLLATVMTSTTSGFRFPGNLNCDLRKLAVNLVPFPRLHFFANNVFFEQTYPHVASKLVQMLFNPTAALCSVDYRDGQTFAAGVAVRGPVSTFEVESSLQQFSQKNWKYFMDCIPNNLNVSMCKQPARPGEVAGMCMNGTTSIVKVFKLISAKFAKQFRVKGHLHFYTNEGMDAMDFTNAECNLDDIISDYHYFQEVRSDYSEGDEEE